MAKQTKVIVRRKKFQEVNVPLIQGTIELLGENVSEIIGSTVTLDLTRQLKGKSAEVVVKVFEENGKAVAHPIKMKLMPYFIRRMIRKKISYVEDSLKIPSQESILIVKPFLITRKRVSRAVRNALRNRAKNWLEDSISQLSDREVFGSILSNSLQKSLSLVLKKTYPLSLCEIRILEIKRPLEESEVPQKIAKKDIIEVKRDDGFIDQMAEIEAEKVKEAEKEIKRVQKEAVVKEAKEKEAEIGEVEDVKESIVKKKTSSKSAKKTDKKE